MDDPGLLAENAGLTEWPVTLIGRIEARFLDLPPEVLQTTMRTNQKFFSLRDPASARITGYVVVANRDTVDDGATVLAGNARVLTARLADAEFFWQNDLRTPLADMTAKLAAVTFHNKLGTQADRIARIAALAREIAPAVGADPLLTERAAELAKADLASQMVYEFPELQGTMGRYYAERAGEDPAVAAAAPEHYAPLGPSDAVPTAPVSVAVALADKIDMLTGFWAIDEKPTGSRDPFALRRAALGVIRIVLEGGIRMPLSPVLEMAFTGHRANERFHARVVYREADSTFSFPAYWSEKLGAPADPEDNNWGIDWERDTWIDPGATLDDPVPGGLDYVATSGQQVGRDHIEARAYGFSTAHSTRADLLGFLADRLKVHLRSEGIRHDVIDACFELGGQDDLVLLVARVRALQDFLATDDGANLLAGYKRAVNILTQEEKKDGVEYSLDPLIRFAETDAERGLFAALDEAEAGLEPALEAEDFAAAMTALARLRAPIDAFFETTTVNADSPAVRRNRLCLLNRIRAVMNRVAVFSAVEGG